MLKIRLSRGGKRNDPFYSIVVIESTQKRNGKPIAKLGFWNPRKNVIKIDKKLVKKYVDNGAQVSDAVKKLLK